MKLKPELFLPENEGRECALSEVTVENGQVEFSLELIEVGVHSQRQVEATHQLATQNMVS